jgi:PEP-CTERM motif
MKFPALALAATFAAFVVPASAQAATVVITYSGVILEGLDVTGVFGTAGQNLTGIGYTSVYTLTDSVPDVIINDDGSAASIYGGSNYGVATPVSVTLTINGITQSVGGNYIGIAAQGDGLPALSSYDIVFHEAQDYTTDTITETNNLVYNVIQSYNNNFVFSSSYLDVLNYNVQNNDSATGAFQFFTGSVSNGIGPVNAYGTLTPQTINIAASVTSAVPEPTTWAMMFAGFGLVGFASRRSKVTARVRFQLA